MEFFTTEFVAQLGGFLVAVAGSCTSSHPEARKGFGTSDELIHSKENLSSSSSHPEAGYANGASC